MIDPREDEEGRLTLELVQINVEGSIETERSSDRRNDLSDDSVQVLESGRLDTEVLAADVVDSCR